jgi:glycosidase
MKRSPLLKRLWLFIAALVCFNASASEAQQNTYWWNDAVFYEIFVRSFYDSNGDGIGDLKGLIQKLNYLNDGNPATTSDLGVTGIWLMPISQSPSYHGYDVIDYRSLEQDYGALADFHALIDSAHARGIKVIIDFVMNHSSSQHPWFINSASSPNSTYRNWYIWRNQDPGYRGPWGQQVWHFRNGAYYFGIFWSGMPDLNYANLDVKKEMFDAARFWLNTMKADGFRLDAIKHLFEDGPVMENVPATLAFLKELRLFYKNVNPNAMTVGEVWSDTNQILLYSDGTKVDFCFEFPTALAILRSVNEGQLNWIDGQMQTVVNSYPFLQYAPFLANHDQDRVFDQLGQNLKKMKLAAAVYLTLPGIPFMYYGEEVAMAGSGIDENKRKPMQWTSGANAGFTAGTPWYPLNSNYGNFNVQKMQADATSLWHWYRKLIDIRNKQEALRRGDYARVNSNTSGLYAYARRMNQEVLIILHNFQNQVLSNPALMLGGSNLRTGVHTVKDVLAGKTVGTVSIENNGRFTNWRPNVDLPALGTAVLKIDSAATTAVANFTDPLPAQFALSQNYPNPFLSGTHSPALGGRNSSTTIQYALPKAAYVKLTVFDLAGKEIATLVNKMQTAGEYKIQWRPNHLAGGIYLCRLQVDQFTATRKLILLR